MNQQTMLTMQLASWVSPPGLPAYRIPAEPRFSPKPGQYSPAKTVKIHAATPGTAIHYTLDGSRPTAASPLYTGPISVNSSTTIQAMAIGLNRFWSPVATGVYKLNIAPANPAAQQPQSPELVPAPQSEEQARPQFAPAPPIRLETIQAGTKLALALMDPIYTKTARPGDNVYMETTFPVSVGNEMLVPPGTFVQGTIEEITRHGHGPLRTSVEMQVRLGKFTFVVGYAADIPDSSNVASSEGGFSVPDGGRTTAVVAAGVGTPATGLAIGALANGIRGAAIGGPIGAGVGAVAAIILLTRNQDVYIGIGTPMNMPLGSPVTFDIVKAGGPPDE